MLRLLSFALASSMSGAPEPSAEARVHLQWDAPEGCPPAAYVRERTEALLARGLDDPRHPEVDARVTVRRLAGRWSASLELATRSGRRARTLQAGTCEALADAAGLLLAMTIDPTAISSLDASAPEVLPTDRSPFGVPEAVPTEDRPDVDEAEPDVVEAEPVVASSREPSPQRPAPRPPPGRRRPLSFLGAAFSLQGGGAPGLALGVSGAGGLGWRRARLLVAAAYAAPVQSLALAPDVRLRALQGWVAVAGCGLLVRGRLEAPLCGGWFAGAIRAVASGLEDDRPVRLPWTGPVLGAGLRFALRPRVAAAADVLALVPVVRPSFEVAGLGVVHQAASVAVSGQLGLEIRFP